MALPPLSDRDRLDIPLEEMRRLGYQAVDLIVERIAGLGEIPAVGPPASRVEMERRLREAPPRTGEPFARTLATYRDDILDSLIPPDHPRNFAWVPGPSTFIGALGDFLGAGCNLAVSSWMEAAGPAQVELLTLDWIRDWIGMPETTGGIYTSGGSMANLTGLQVGRSVHLDGDITGATVYCTTQVHSSVTRNLRVLGFRETAVRRVAIADDLRMDLDDLRRLIAADRAAGLRPFCLIGTAGTTNTGTVDPLNAMADICADNDMWFHIDGAYGAAGVLAPQGQAALGGMERAHSLAIDPHKWLFQPIEMGCTLVREAHWLDHTYAERPEYLAETYDDTDTSVEVNFGDRGPQLTRAARALKLWMTVKYFGEDALRAAVARGFDNAERAEELVRAHPCFAVTSPAQMGIVTFRYTHPNLTPDQHDTVNSAIYRMNHAKGWSMFTTTKIKGMKVLRLCMINPRISDAEIQQVIADLKAFGDAAVAELAAA